MFTVGDVMSRGELITLKEGDDLGLAEAMFQFGRIRHLPVVRDGTLQGLLTHRDFLRALSRRGEVEGRRTLAGEVMRRGVRCTEPGTPLAHALGVMMRQKYGCLPVVLDGRLVGMLTETDVLGFARNVVTEMDAVERLAEGLRH